MLQGVFALLLFNTVQFYFRLPSCYHSCTVVGCLFHFPTQILLLFFKEHCQRQKKSPRVKALHKLEQQTMLKYSEICE